VLPEHPGYILEWQLVAALPASKMYKTNKLQPYGHGAAGNYRNKDNCWFEYS
jgi:hypothetical protein